MKPQLALSLSGFVSAVSLRRQLAGLPLIARGSDFDLVCEYAPAQNAETRPLFQLNQTADISGEAAVCLLAFSDWLGGSANLTNAIRLATKGGWLQEPRRIVLDADLTSTRQHAHHFVDKIERSSIFSKYREFHSARLLLQDFVWEGLLNVAQHAYEGEGKAWIAARVWKGKDFQERHSKSFVSGVEQRWTGAIGQQAEYVLEISIADRGKGIVSTIANSFATHNPDYMAAYTRRKAAGQVEALHDAALAWALAPYSTRKSTDDFESEAYANIWRGLYRILYRADRVSAYLSVSSGIGRFGSCAIGQKRFLLNSDATFDIGDRSIPWPWTCLTLRLPLSRSKETRKPKMSRSGRSAASALELQAMAVMPATSRDLLGQTFSVETKHDAYVELMGGQINRLKIKHDVSTSAVGMDVGQLFIGIAHPFLSVNSRATHGDSAPERRKYAEMVLERILSAHAVPGVVPIHLFIEVMPDSLELVSQRLSMAGVNAAGGTPFIVGYVAPGKTSISWISGTKPTAGTSFIPQIDPDRQADSLREIFGGFVDSNNRVALPAIVSSSAVDDATRQVLTALGTHRKKGSSEAPWYWEAQRDATHSPVEFVLTGSGSRVTRYVSLIALSNKEPVVWRIIKRKFLDALDDAASQINNQDRPIVVLCDTDTSSYVLARRLVQAFSSRIDVPIKVLAPQNVEPQLQGSQVIFFADVLYRGNSLRRLIERAIGLGIEDLLDGALCFACLQYIRADARPEWVDVQGRKFSIRNALQLPGDGLEECDVAHIENEKILRVDPITNELISEDLNRDWERFNCLLWRDGVSDPTKQNASLTEADLIYGLQRIDNRVHVLRCPTKNLLGRADIRKDLCERLVTCINSLQTNSTQASDVVLFIRRTSSLNDFISPILDDLAKSTSKSNASLFLAEIDSHVYHGKQTLGHGLGRAVQNAERYAYGMRGTRSLFDNDQPRQAFIAVYLDNSAISGRALREFLCSFKYSKSIPHPQAAVLFPIVSKISPSQDRLFSQIIGVRSDGGAGSQDAPSLRAMFGSYIQLRIRTFDSFLDTELYRKLDSFVEAGQKSASPELAPFFGEIRQLMNSMELLKDGEVVQCPFESPVTVDHPEYRRASLEAIDCRQKLALRQQGGPFSGELICSLRNAFAREDMSLAAIFSLEPDLVTDDLLVQSIRPDLADYCVGLLSNDGATSSQRKNALWVLAQMPEEFVVNSLNCVRALRIKDDELILWSALALFYLPPTAAQSVIQKVLTGAERDGEATATFNMVIQVLRASQIVGEDWHGAPQTSKSDARQTLVNFMADSRFQHGDAGFAGWLNLTDAMSVGSLGEAELAELISNWQQCGVEDLIKNRVIPVIRAIERLSGAAPQGTIDRLRGGLWECSKAFIALADLFQGARANDPTLGDRFSTRWRNLLQYSFHFPWDSLVSKEGQLVLLEDVGAPVGSAPALIDSLIFRVVQDPLACTIHAVTTSLAKGQQYELTLKYGDLDIPATLYSASDLTKIIRDVWRSCTTVAVCWDSQHRFLTAIKVLAKNVGKYASSNCPIRLRVAFDAAEEEFRLEIINGIAPTRAKGQETGNQRIRKLIEGIVSGNKHGSYSTEELPSSEYKTTIRIPVATQSVRSLDV